MLAACAAGTAGPRVAARRPPVGSAPASGWRRGACLLPAAASAPHLTRTHPQLLHQCTGSAGGCASCQILCCRSALCSAGAWQAWLRCRPPRPPLPPRAPPLLCCATRCRCGAGWCAGKAVALITHARITHAAGAAAPHTNWPPFTSMQGRDTLAALAVRHGTDVAALKRLNNLLSDSALASRRAPRAGVVGRLQARPACPSPA